MTNLRQKLYDDLMDEISKSDEGAPCENRGLLFFPEGSDYIQRAAEAEAKLICATCPFKNACAAYGIGAREQYGVWGGTTPLQRQRLWAKANDVKATHEA